MLRRFFGWFTANVGVAVRIGNDRYPAVIGKRRSHQDEKEDSGKPAKEGLHGDDLKVVFAPVQGWLPPGIKPYPNVF